MRITSSMITGQYAKNLNKSLYNLNTASNKATTFRKFDKSSEDPFSAAKAYRLRREFQQNDDYQSTLKDVDSQLLTAESSMLSINSIVQEASSGDCIQAINGTLSPEDREIIATKLHKLQDAILSAANTKYANKFVFAGAKTEEPPFSLDESGNLLYRGIDVNTGKISAGTTTTINNVTIQFGKQTVADFNGYTIKVAAGAPSSADAVSLSGNEITVTMDLSAGKTNKDLLNALKNKTDLTDTSGKTLDFSHMTMSGELDLPLTDGATSAAAYDTVGKDGLQDLANEKAFVDLGMSLRFNDDGSINTQSVFNTAIPGLSFMGYGSNSETGVSNNLYTLLGKIADQLKSSAFSMENIQPYLDSFSNQGQVLLSEITKSGTNSSFLKTKKVQLETIGDSVNNELVRVEYLDSAEAIMDYKEQLYAYRAALQMGTKIIQPSFLDFMD